MSKKITSIWPNGGADIDEKLLESGVKHLNNICWNCGSMTLYIRETVLGPYLACASEGCEGSFDSLLKNAFKHRMAYYKQNGIEL